MTNEQFRGSAYPMSKLLPWLAAVCACLAVVAAPAAPAREKGPVAQHGRLQVRDGRITGADGQPVSLAGNSFFWSQWSSRFYNDRVVSWLREDWGATVVRAALGVDNGDGYLGQPKANLASVTRIVDAAIAEDIYVIV